MHFHTYVQNIKTGEVRQHYTAYETEDEARHYTERMTDMPEQYGILLDQLGNWSNLRIYYKKCEVKRGWIGRLFSR